MIRVTKLIIAFVSVAILFNGGLLSCTAPTAGTELWNSFGQRFPEVRAYAKIIHSTAEKHNVPAALIAAVIKAESGFNPKAVSKRGAKGLMQLNRVTRIEMKLNNAFDPKANIHAGTRYLKRLMKRYNGNIELVLAAYNAGPSAVARHGGIPPYGQTRRYVPKVINYYLEYQTL